MKLRFSLLMIVLAATAALALSPTPPVYPVHYGVIGRLLASDDGHKPGGYSVNLYKAEDPSKAAAGVTVDDGRYVINGLENANLLLMPGAYKLFVPTKDDYGADAVDVNISAMGYTMAPDIKLQKGKGGGAVPVIENIKFGNRAYQKAMVARGDKFIVSATPKISATVKSDFGIYTNETGKQPIQIIINSGSAGQNTMTVKDVRIKQQDAGAIKELSFSQDVPEANKLNEGGNTVTFLAANDAGTAQEIATVTVMSGPLSIIGDILTFPSPFSPSKHGVVFVQYTLSGDGDIDIILVSGAKQVVKKIVCFKGTEGGSAGVNKVPWNGQTDQGQTVGNGIYSGVITSRAEGRILAKFKLTVVD